MSSILLDMSLLPGLDFGVGVDPVLHQLHGWLFEEDSIKPTWIDPDEDHTDLPSHGSSVIDYIETTTELEKRVAVSAFGEYSGATFSASGSAKFMSELKTSSNSVYLLVDIEVVIVEKMLRNPRVSPALQKWASEHSREQFEAKFGTHYVSGIKSGGRFVGVVTLHGMAESAKREFQAELRASGWGVKAGVNFDTSFRSTMASHRVNAKAMWSGGKEVVSFTPDEMLAAAKSFPDRVREQPYPYRAILREYASSIILPDFNGDSLEARQERWDRMRALARDRQRYTALERDIEFTMDHIWDQEQGEGIVFKEYKELSHEGRQQKLGYWMEELKRVRVQLDRVNSAARVLQSLAALPEPVPFYQPNEPIPTLEGESSVLKEIKEQLNALPPVGSVIMWSGSTANIPKGWSLCDGSRGTPDLRERFVMGAGKTAAHTSGEADPHTHSVDPPPATFRTNEAGEHEHKMPASWYFRRLEGGDHHGIDVGNPKAILPTQSSGSHAHTGTVDIAPFTSKPSSGPNRPRWYALCFIMRIA